MPVTVKVRLLESREATLDLLRGLQEAGADAITVHLRLASTGETQPALGWPELQALTAALPTLPLLVNGDMYSMHRVREMVRLSGCAGAILARPILLNASCLREQGPLPQLDVRACVFAPSHPISPREPPRLLSTSYFYKHL